MFSVAALVPSPPVLVPEMGGAAGVAEGGQVAAVRAAVFHAVEALSERAQRWVVVGVSDTDRHIGPEAVGTFRGFGLDLPVGLSAAALGNGTRADPSLPLPVLIGGWLRGILAPNTVAQARLLAEHTPGDAARKFGARLREELDSDAAPTGVLVVGDGAATLSTASPRYFDERATAVQTEIDRALTAGDREGLAALNSELCEQLCVAGRPAYQALAGLFAADPVDPLVETSYAAAPFGVGYHVSVWRPGDSR
ncbi:hypothetical protein HLB23_34375 [Nocardia uniformis]|uniref:Uncharacterized protein n=1 Tax=Nocardia uniformis TaxID=53432 RepID=A0A849CGK3_9NOCA|nr:hypothetical protein [Nocardia uniformis]NNH74879.1 hypothetical protein [Nocardia uniformis]